MATFNPNKQNNGSSGPSRLSLKARVVPLRERPRMASEQFTSYGFVGP
jgi:hypothetical protein